MIHVANYLPKKIGTLQQTRNYGYKVELYALHGEMKVVVTIIMSMRLKVYGKKEQ